MPDASRHPALELRTSGRKAATVVPPTSAPVTKIVQNPRVVRLTRASTAMAPSTITAPRAPYGLPLVTSR